MTVLSPHQVKKELAGPLQDSKKKYLESGKYIYKCANELVLLSFCGLDFLVLVTVLELWRTSCSPAWSLNPCALTVAPRFNLLRAPTDLIMAMPRAPTTSEDIWVHVPSSRCQELLLLVSSELSFRLQVPWVVTGNSCKALWQTCT